ncbi:hypothetical protein V6N12_036803 [Hibiscus sabdariffa]|uniref:Uncharacterized protein n=1 Tax=Hibiscus sabdariffa TaxID=183260 RepID=A0ABR2BUS3_9ROSI
MLPLHKKRNPDLIIDPNILLNTSTSFDKTWKYGKDTNGYNIDDPLTKPLTQQKHDRRTESLHIRNMSDWTYARIDQPRQMKLPAEILCPGRRKESEKGFRFHQNIFLNIPVRGARLKEVETIQRQDPKPMHAKDYLECKFSR